MASDSNLRDRAVDCLPAGLLEKRLAEGTPLRIKFGVDPTAPDIHLGHTVPLTKLREFQDAGHTAVLIIGDWTARIGDPSGRSATRPRLSADDVAANAETYRVQASSILDPARTEVRFNGEWFAGMDLEAVFALAGQATVNQMLHRKDFAERFAADQPISVLELLYPLMQGYDSVQVQADVELGGTDQLFNLMMGRVLQEAHGQRPQVVMTMPILPGTDGVRRMGKSLGNYIGVTETPEEQFGKAMSIPDEAMTDFYRLLFPGEPGPEADHPAAAKRRLGRLIAGRYHGSAAGAQSEAHFDRTVRDRTAPDDVAELALADGTVHLPALLVDSMGVQTRSEARRLLTQGAVTLDGKPITAVDLDAAELRGGVLKAGKRRFLRIIAPSP